LFGLVVVGLILVFIALMFSIRIVRPTEKGVVERLGKFSYVADQGIHFLIPFVDQMYKINLTERMVGAEPQEVITSDNLNAIVDAQVYFKVRSDDESVKRSIYAVNDYEVQIVSLARTTLRDVIGNLSLKDANSQRNKINEKLQGILQTETRSWGIDIVRTELKEIQPACRRSGDDEQGRKSRKRKSCGNRLCNRPGDRSRRDEKGSDKIR